MTSSGAIQTRAEIVLSNMRVQLDGQPQQQRLMSRRWRFGDVQHAVLEFLNPRRLGRLQGTRRS